MKRKSITIQTCGGAGDGSVVTGVLLAKGFVKMGYHVFIYDTFPAEIRGYGKTLSEVRVSNDVVAAKADKVDILLGLNDTFVVEQLPKLSEDAIIIYDSKPGIVVSSNEDVIAHAPPTMQCHGIPLKDITQRVTGRKLGRNVVALGFLTKLLRQPIEPFLDVLKEQFSVKGEKVLKNNITLFEEGYSFEEEEKHKEHRIDLIEPTDDDREHSILSGNDALVKGALNAELHVFAGYPITPASKILELLAKDLPKQGGVVLQTEDEIAAAGVVAGAFYTGKRSMTATSGPGLCLMTEMINLSVMSETPMVIVNVMRGGPSTGLPTKVEQADFNLALYGGHGDSPRVVLAPSMIGECYSVIQDAFDVAEKYQTPVIVLSDKFIAMSNMDVPHQELEGSRTSTRKEYAGAPEEYNRYEVTDDGVSPWALPGENVKPYTVTGLAHNERGQPDYAPEKHALMTEKRFRKFEVMLEDLPPPEVFGDIEAPNLIISWGSTFSAIQEAVQRLEEHHGYKVKIVKMKTLFPQHEKEMRALIENSEKVIIPEQNKFCQVGRFIKGFYGIDAKEVSLPSGEPVCPGDVEKLLQEVLI